MISSEAKLDESLLQEGIYHFQIHDTFHHCIGSLETGPDYSPNYAQLYFYDVDTAVQQRMQIPANCNCNQSNMRELSTYLGQVNPFVQSFHTMAEVNCAQNLGEEANIGMYLMTRNSRNVDLRCFN